MDLYMTVIYNSTTGVSEEHIWLNEAANDACYEEYGVPATGGFVGAYTMVEGVNKTINQANADHYKD